MPRSEDKGRAAAIANGLVGTLQPRSVLHVRRGGLSLVRALQDRAVAVSELGVDAALSESGEWRVPSFSGEKSPEERYDVVVCLDGSYDVSSNRAPEFVQKLASITDAVLFASEPNRDGGHDHPRKSPALIDWLRLFAGQGFVPDVLYDPSFMMPQAVLVRRREGGAGEMLLAATVELVRQRVISDQLFSQVDRGPGSTVGRGGFAQAADLVPSREDLVRQKLSLQRRCAELESTADEVSSKLTDLQKQSARQARELMAARLQVASRSLGEQPTSDDIQQKKLTRPALLDRLGDVLSTRRQRNRRRRLRLAESLQRSGFVDPNWYLQRYPAVVLEGMSVAEHYVRSGAAEMRNPSGLFSTKRYLQAYPEVRSLGLNPLHHYLSIGQQQGRQTFPSEPDRSLIAASEWFDADWYLGTYPDIAAAGIDPALHYLEDGGRENRDPGPRFSTRYYVDNYPDVCPSGQNPLIHFLETGLPEGRSPAPIGKHAPMQRRDVDSTGATATAVSLVAERFKSCRPLTVYTGVEDRPRLTILTDSINAGSLFGGVATSIIFGTLLARHMGATLRIITRTQEAEAENVATVLEAHDIPGRPNIEFGFAPLEGVDQGFEFNANETLLTTSWWGTRAALATVNPAQIVYLIQEDERMFYAQGDEQLACYETINHPSLCCVVNSELLFRFFESEKLSNLVQHGLWFEPSFPIKSYYSHEDTTRKEKLQFFFYARPLNHRNLFFRGLSVVNEGLARGILDPSVWDFHFAGNAIPGMTLAGGARPIVHPLMDWDEYGRFIRTIDLGLSLMYTPHPSYPPLDLAASGGVALTNTFANKQDLKRYSDNIVCVPPDLESLLAGLQTAVDLTLDPARRRRNYDGMTLSRSWPTALESVMSRLVK